MVTIHSRCFCNRELAGNSRTRPEPVLNKKPHILHREQHLNCQHSVSLPSVELLLPFLTQRWHVEASLSTQTVFGLCDKMSKIVSNTLQQLGMFVHLEIPISFSACLAVMNTKHSLPFYISGSVLVTQETRVYKVLQIIICQNKPTQNSGFLVFKHLSPL